MKSASTPIDKRIAAIRRTATLLLAMLYLGPLALIASVTFRLEAELLNTSAGAGSPAPQSSLVLLLADTARNGFAALQAGGVLTLGSLLGGDDKIIFRTDLSNLSTNGVLFTATPGLNLDSMMQDSIAGSWSPGDALAIVWFPSLSLSSGTLIGGASYGRLTMGTPAGATPASSPFVTPSDLAGDYELSYFSNEAGANNINALVGPGSPTSADLVVVPEPSVPLLLMTAGGVLLHFRRTLSTRRR